MRFGRRISLKLIYLALIFLAPVVGCGPKVFSTSGGVEGSMPGFQISGRPDDCRNECWDQALTFIRADLGLDPQPGERRRGDHLNELWEQGHKGAGSVGGLERSASVSEALNAVEADGDVRAALIDGNGHALLVVGAVEDGAEKFFQVIHGNSQIILFDRPRLAAESCREAWVFTRPPSKGTTIAFGGSSINVNEVNHNFGAIKAGAKLSCDFVIKNNGNHPVDVDQPHTSCSCTVADVPESKYLAPGEAMRLPVSVDALDATSVRQKVEVLVTEHGNFLGRKVTFQLLGSRISKVSVSPGRLDLGGVLLGGTVTDSVFLEESNTARFRVKRVGSSSANLGLFVAETRRGNGLRKYRVSCMLSVRDLEPGEYTELFYIYTNNPKFRELPVPVSFRVLPPLLVEPSIVALGEVPVGRAQGQSVRLVNRTGMPMTIEITDYPEEVTVRHDGRDAATLPVAVTLSAPGLWQGTVRGVAKIGGSSHPFEIPCTAYGNSD